MSRPILGAFGLAVLASACTTSPSRSHDAPDATSTADPVAPPSSRAVEVVATLARVEALAANLAAGRALERFDDRFRPKKHAWSSADVSLPAHAAAPLRIEARASGAWIEVAAVDLTGVGAQSTTTALVFPAARAATDVVLVATPNGAEELRLLRTSDAPSDARWRIHVGPGIGTVRVRQGRIEALDHAGVARIVAEAPFAVDARGTRRDLSLTLEAVEGDWLATASLDTAGLAYPIAIDPLWRTGASALPSNVVNAVAGLLPSGKIFVAGDGVGTKPALYDPSADTWTVGKLLSKNVNEPWGVVLSTGNVLLGTANNTQAELWNETAGTLATPTASFARGGDEMHPVHVDFGLPTERVYFFGGRPGFGSGTVHSSAERYDVVAGTFVSIATMPRKRMGAATALLPGKKILIAGGWDSGGLSDALLYDVATDTYEPIASPLPNTHWSGRAIVLDNGKVLIAGGDSGAYTATNKTTLYDVSTKVFSNGPAMSHHRSHFDVAKIGPGKWMLLGGNGKLVGAPNDEQLASTEVYDEATNTFTAGPSMIGPHERAAVVSLSGGRILVAGGYAPSASTYETYYLDPVECTTSGPGCANCVDGFCCDRPCTGQCEACDVAGRQGVCQAIVGEPPHGTTRPACTPTLLCGPGGACQTNCASDGACAPGNYCTTGGVCAPKKTNGAGCSLGAECGSGICVDGVCCNAACGGQCQACDVAGSVGTCTNVVGAPHGTRAPCAAGYACDGAGLCASGCTSDAQCASTHYCGAGGTCTLRKAQGSLCAHAGECTTKSCVDGVCCNTDCTGACQACDVSGNVGKCTNVAGGPPRAGKSCGAYAACAAGACATSCTADAQCSPGHYCLSGACVARKTSGAACGTAGECATGFCADGVCCDAACAGECQTCKLPGSEGSCRPKPSTSFCGLAGCVGSNTITRGTCSGVDDRCTLGTITPCPNGLKCADAVSCKTACATGADCVTGVCDTDTGTCTTAWDGGLPDTGADASEPDTSVADTSEPDTFVPDTAVADTAEPADARPIADAPAPQLPATPAVSSDFQRCTQNSECATGFCVEGVCCDSKCDQPCHSCALLSSPGKCTLEPVGVDLKNDCGPAYTCLGTCGPKGECIGSGSGTMCGRNRCVGPSSGVGPAYCSAPGSTCPVDDAVPFECEPYICEPAFGACRTSCASSADCKNGFVCDVPSKTCIAPSVPAADDGGCAVSEPGASRGGAIVALGLALAGVAARRRRRSARI